MDQILENLQDPSWWFTGIFFLLVGMILTRALSSWLPITWKLIGKLVPKITLRLQRWKERRILKIVKRYRQHQTEVIWLTTRYWSLMTLFIFYAGFLAISFSLQSEVSGKSTEIRKLFPLVLPLYVFQSIVMWEQVVLKIVRMSHIQWKNRRSRCSSEGIVNDAV